MGSWQKTNIREVPQKVPREERKRSEGDLDRGVETETTGGGRGRGLVTGDGAGQGTGRRGRETPGIVTETPRTETARTSPGETVRSLMESRAALGSSWTRT